MEYTFVITDTGIGIPSEKLATIFDSFNQADASTTRKYGGTGLGLSICKNLVEIQGGSIQAYSDADQGSSFAFTLRYGIGNESDIEVKEDLEIKNLAFSKLKVLCADDHQMNRFLATSILEGWGCEVHSVSNGKECLDRLKIHNYDLILMDMQMPIMDGMEATKIIRSTFETPKKEIPIIALTANAMKGDKEECIRAGMNDYITKPFEPKELYSKIVKLLNPSLKIELSNNNVLKPSYDISLILSMAGDNKEFIHQMIEKFIEETEPITDELVTCVKNIDFIGISRIIHKIRPTLDYLGIGYIKTDIDAIQKNVKLNILDNTTKEQIGVISDTLKKVISDLKRDFF